MHKNADNDTWDEPNNMKLAEKLRQLLLEGVTGNQKQLVRVLADAGLETTQSSVSRALKKIQAVKSVDDSGNTVYRLPVSPAAPQPAPSPSEIFESLALGVDHNEHLIVVHTKPGTAMTVAKFIDDRKFDEVMGTVAGDDTIMIIPKRAALTRSLADHVKTYLVTIGIMG